MYASAQNTQFCPAFLGRADGKAKAQTRQDGQL
jgi:hypothetical protein